MHYLIIVLIAALFCQEADCSPQKEITIQEINGQIEMLCHKQRMYRAQARRHLDEAGRWQFNSRMFSETRQAYSNANNALRKADRIEKQIQELNMRKLEMPLDDKD